MTTDYVTPVQPAPARRRVGPGTVLLVVAIALVGLGVATATLFASDHNGRDNSQIGVTQQAPRVKAVTTSEWKQWATDTYGDAAWLPSVTNVKTNADGYTFVIETSLYPKRENEATAVKLCQAGSMWLLGQSAPTVNVKVNDSAGNVLVSQRALGDGCHWRR